MNFSFLSFSDFLTFANCLTLLRIFLSPVILLLIAFNHIGEASVVFLTASLTDWFDGFYARRFNQISFLGQLLDPLADKILIISTYVALYSFCSYSMLLPFWFILLVISRDIGFLCLSSLILLKEKLTLPSAGTSLIKTPLLLGKLNTFLQMGYAFLILYFESDLFQFSPFSEIVIGLISCTTVVSTLLYGIVFLKSQKTVRKF